MEQKTYEAVIEALVDKLSLTEWRLSKAHETLTELKQENINLKVDNETLRKERNENE